MFSTFTAIFEALDDIEKELSGEKSEAEKEELINTLLSLRKTMDKCVQYWLRFEERVNEIQERYGLSLPDTLPEGFMGTPEYWEEMVTGEKPQEKGEEPQKEESRPEEIKSEVAISSFRRGLGFWELAMLKEAVGEFKKVVEEEPDLILGHFCLGLSSAQLGQVEEAFRELKLVLALDKNRFVQALALNTLGILMVKKEQPEQALQYFIKANEADPNLREAWFNRASTLYNLKRYQECVEAFKKAEELFPGDWEVELYLGRALGYLGRYKEAAQALERAYRHNPREPIITFELGFVYRLLGETERANEYFNTTRQLLDVKG
ncbi:MAG TPA: tetratricopeptide repeat protein [Bacillota bacterium]|jgi:tetratricopeptide (TPR) repeat protein|nr:tetratricopeptide repeat protein [Bacillota bacterium]HOB86805.1 tetratricopeptide repeat protein [Bacillota bacterium]HOP69044.1 tetratricopeptide repeat protein [Bacillota bacterium]HPT33676.1 tetratricopeptide repeat protein [Bacillota bacterium]HPZ64884.1 tetratricopeptide repeat protein [Bacillota bacterium]